MKRFEYVLLQTGSGFFGGFDYEQLHERLNDLGSQGWEVVAVTNMDTGQGRTTGLFLTLKRELLPAG